ncbi:MAG: RHS repeat-associated core domain-containing protein [Methylococcales bacterium]
MILITGGAAYTIHSDHLNTPRLIVNQANQIVWRWDNTDPFGNNGPNENPSGLGTFTFNKRFDGQYFDKETNTHYNWWRTYFPDIGRYGQSDPTGLEGGINTYAYVDSNPLSYYDPTGQTKTGVQIGGAIGGGIGAVVGGVIGGSGGAAGGTVVAPGLGTLGGGAYGAVQGAAIGTAIGTVFGAALGSTIEDFLIFAKGGKEQGRNWATEEAKSRAQKNCSDPCTELAKMLEAAKGMGDTKAVRDIIQAQKFLHCRNIRKRDSHY